MEPSNQPNQPSSLSPFLPDTGAWGSKFPQRDHDMNISDTPQTAYQVNKASPSLQPGDPVRIALLINKLKSLEAVSLLEQIPGIEVVGVAKHQLSDQEPLQGSESHFPFGTPSTLLLQHTAPHVLLDFTGVSLTHPLGDHDQLANTEIPGPYTASLLEKLVEHQRGAERQMAQIEKLASIGTLASGILHDINNPLYVILGFSEMLLEEHHSPEVRDQAMEVLQATKRIIKMCEDLNLYARQSTPKETVQVNLTQQLEEAMKVARFSVGLENITVVRTYAAHPIVLARPEEIVQIFVNLVVNALQAMNGHGTLTLGAKSSDLKATISIGDTGPGISQENMRKIFEPFFTTKPPGKGTGLGLYSVRSLVQQYGGQIFIHSVVGEGTTFHLEFPLLPDPVPCKTA